MSNTDMLGRIVVKLVALSEIGGGYLFGVILDILEKLLIVSTPNPWVTEIKRFARKEPCWIPNFLKEDLNQFLHIARMFLIEDASSHPEPVIICMIRNNISLTPQEARSKLDRLVRLGVLMRSTRGTQDSRYKVLMTIREFEDTFGLKLPS